MKIIQSLMWSVAFVGTVGCGSDGGGGSGPTSGFDDQALVVDFADQVVVPTYTLLEQRIGSLETAVDALATNPTAETFKAAQDAWIAARQPWEQSEGFLFGPVDAYGYDPAMDSWPVNTTDLDAVLASGSAFTPEYVGNLQETQKGFHTIEYLLFGVGRKKTVADLTPRELSYVSAIAAELTEIATALESSWTDGVDGRPPYRDIFANAGQPGNTSYPSRLAAVQEILDGIIGICDEVANGKIAGPYDAHDPTLVESQFAFNSITDFQDNLRSVENVYSGGVPAAGTSGKGLSAYVAERDSALDARVKSELAAAIEAIGAIPPPFRDAIVTPSSYSAIEAAQAAVRKVHDTLQRDVRPLVQE
ncbi:MAG: peptidase M75 [Sorangiineae bacterium]|nr:peptidase M75 [Polyangiaceae bacterium]MEB2324840.1 peptidase M75 [Sorangiineae bacterium]